MFGMNNQNFKLSFVLLLILIVFSSCSNHPSEEETNSSDNDVIVYDIEISDDISANIQNITESCRISLTGTINSDLLIDIGSSLSALYEKDSSIRIELDLSGTNGMEVMPHEGFRGCLSLESIIFPEGLKTIEVEPFDHCDNLKKIYIPSTTNSIGAGLWKGCNLLERISLVENNQFYKIVGDVIYNKNGTKLVGYPIYKTDKEFSIPAGINEIDKAAFYNNDKIEKVAIPSGVTGIDEYVFKGCTNLREMIIPASVASFGGGCLSGCTNLNKIIFLGTQEQWNSINKAGNWDNNTGNYTVDIRGS